MSIEHWDGLGSKIDRSADSSEKVNGILEEKLPEIAKIADDVVDILKDGWQFSDVVSFCKVVGPLIELVDGITSLSEDEKDDFVAEAVWMIYKTVDTYPDGNSNNINIPILFGSLEEKVEKMVIDFAARSAIHAVRSYAEKH